MIDIIDNYAPLSYGVVVLLSLLLSSVVYLIYAEVLLAIAKLNVPQQPEKDQIMLTQKHIEKIKAKIASKSIDDTHMYISYSTVEKLIKMVEGAQSNGR